jgi:hypothetical protein
VPDFFIGAVWGVLGLAALEMLAWLYYWSFDELDHVHLLSDPVDSPEEGRGGPCC